MDLCTLVITLTTFPIREQRGNLSEGQLRVGRHEEGLGSRSVSGKLAGDHRARATLERRFQLLLVGSKYDVAFLSRVDAGNSTNGNGPVAEQSSSALSSQLR